MTDITISQIAAAIESPVTKSLVAAYLVQRATAETLRAKIDAIYREVLTERPVYIAEEWRDRPRIAGNPDEWRITEQSRTYLASDDDCQIIWQEVDKRARAAGIKPDTMTVEYCPASVAESELCDCKLRLAKHAAQMIGMDFDRLRYRLEMYNKFIDLIVGAALASER